MSMSTDITKSATEPTDADSIGWPACASEVLRRWPPRAAPARPKSRISEDSGLAVNVRMGEVETVERTRDRGVAVTVYFGQRKGSASTADLQPASLHRDRRAGLRDRAVHRGRPGRGPGRCRS